MEKSYLKAFAIGISGLTCSYLFPELIIFGMLELELYLKIFTQIAIGLSTIATLIKVYRGGGDNRKEGKEESKKQE